VVLTRDPDAFRNKAPHLAGHASVLLHVGDVQTFAFPEGRFSHVIHAATQSSAPLDPLLMVDTIIAGTRRTLDFAVQCGASKFLLTSSGAVYGPQPSELSHIPETYMGAPDTMRPESAYGEGKRVAELLCSLYHSRYGIETKIARCFAFAGPYLPLDAHFAIGNFVRDTVRNKPIQVNGDGTPFRSYLDAADLMIWLWTILVKGQPCRPYNVGSGEALSIAGLAGTVAASGEPIRITQQAQPDAPAQRYVPSVARARAELGLQQTIPLCDAVHKMKSSLQSQWEGQK
jgi:dTDP-glucose 4,6-dehydratase